MDNVVPFPARSRESMTFDAEAVFAALYESLADLIPDAVHRERALREARAAAAFYGEKPVLIRTADD